MGNDTTPRPDAAVPRGVRIAGAWSWRILVIAAATAVVFWTLSKITLVIFPLLIAALLTSLLLPLVEWLHTRKWPRALAVAVAVLTLIAVITGLIWVSVWQLRSGYPQLQEQALAFWEQTKQWLLDSPLHVSAEDLTAIGKEVADAIRRDAQAILSSAVSVGSTFGHVLAGALLTLFCLIFLLVDGRGIWRFVRGLLPRRSQDAVDHAAKAGWVTLGNFMRVQVVVAGIDAVGIGVGAWILGLPMVVPISILVFLGSFVPVVGAVLTGALAVFIALITLGFWKAVIMLGILLLVQQVESHVLQPLIMGNAVKLHPLGVVLAVTAGSIIAGIPGALFAVPLTAFLNVFVRAVASGEWRQDEADTPDDAEASD